MRPPIVGIGRTGTSAKTAAVWMGGIISYFVLVVSTTRWAPPPRHLVVSLGVLNEHVPCS
jgi:hypothetical protein